MVFFDSWTTIGISPSMIVGLTITTAAITIFLLRAVMRTYHGKVLSGKEELIGAQGVAYSETVSADEGKVFLHGEIWNAVSDENIKRGEKIKVVDVKGLMMKVKKVHSHL